MVSAITVVHETDLLRCGENFLALDNETTVASEDGSLAVGVVLVAIELD